MPRRAWRQRGATGLALVLAAAGGLGCGKNVLVSNWELELKAADAGTETPAPDLPPAAEGADAGVSPNYEASKAAQNARNRAHKVEKEHDEHSDSSDKSSH
jgi:hypothetical protein